MNNTLDILGLIGGFLTTFSFLPQALKAFRSRHTKDLSMPMLLMADIGVVLWFIYGISINNIPLIFANAVSFLFISATLLLKLKYK